jgi:hypothetical protein
MVEWLTEGNGAMLGIDGTGFVNWRWNCKSLWKQLRISSGKTRGWKISYEQW